MEVKLKGTEGGKLDFEMPALMDGVTFNERGSMEVTMSDPSGLGTVSFAMVFDPVEIATLFHRITEHNIALLTKVNTLDRHIFDKEARQFVENLGLSDITGDSNERR